MLLCETIQYINTKHDIKLYGSILLVPINININR